MRSALAMTAKNRGALAHSCLGQQGVTVETGLTATAINLQLLHEIARLAIGTGEILESGAALANCLGQHALDLGHQGSQPLGTDIARRPFGVNAGSIERLVRVDVAHPDHHLIVHQELFDGGAASLGALTQVISTEGIGERLGPQLGEQRVGFGRFPGPQAGRRSGADR